MLPRVGGSFRGMKFRIAHRIENDLAAYPA
jgi:hypothetical protein